MTGYGADAPKAGLLGWVVGIILFGLIVTLYYFTHNGEYYEPDYEPEPEVLDTCSLDR